MKKIFILLIITSTYFNNVYSNVIYVTPNGSVINDGTSWANSYGELYTAIANAIAGDTIAISSGTFTPDVSNGRYSYFSLKDSVKIFGGFIGNEIINSTSINTRDLKSNQTILSGDLNQDDSSTGNTSDNCYHIIFQNQNNLSEETILDGVTISNGAADKAGDSFYDKGAAFYFYANSASVVMKPKLQNLVISNNNAYLSGSAIYTWCYQGNIAFTLENSIICDNNSTAIVFLVGGTQGNLSPKIINCDIIRGEMALGNSTVSGGLSTVLDVQVINSIIANNSQGSVNYNPNKPIKFSYSVIETALTSSMSDLGNNYFAADPMFIDTSSCNDTLYSQSPAINNSDASYGNGNNIGTYQGSGIFTPLSIEHLSSNALASCPNNFFDSIPFSFLSNDPSNTQVMAYSNNQTFIDNSNIVIGGTGSNRYIKFTPTPNTSDLTTVTIKFTSPTNEVDSTSFSVEWYSLPEYSSITIIPTDSVLTTGEVICNMTGNGPFTYYLDGFMSNGNSNTFQNVQEGNHTLSITDINGCESKDSVIYMPKLSSQSIEEQLNQSLKIFPNPASSKLNIYVDFNKKKSIEIISLEGKSVFKDQVKSVINIENIPSGIYFVKVNIDQFVFIRKISIE